MCAGGRLVKVSVNRIPKHLHPLMQEKFFALNPPPFHYMT